MVNSNGQFPDAIEDVFNVPGLRVVRDRFSHAFKVGFVDQAGSRDISTVGNNFNLELPVQFSVAQRRSSPNQLTEYSTPEPLQENIKADLGIYVAGQWTVNEAHGEPGTAVRLFQHLLPAPDDWGVALYTEPESERSPRLRGWPGRTSRLAWVWCTTCSATARRPLKASLNKYVLAYGLQGLFGDGSNPVNLTTHQRDAVVDGQRRGRRHCEGFRAAVRSDKRRRRTGNARPCRARPFGQSIAECERGPGDPPRLGKPRLQLGVLGRRAARAHAARVRRRRVLPPLVRKLHRDRQPQHVAERLHVVQYHGADRSEASWRGRLHR